MSGPYESDVSTKTHTKQKTKQKLQTNPKKKQPIPVVVFRKIKMQNKIQKIVLARCCLDKFQGGALISQRT